MEQGNIAHVCPNSGRVRELNTTVNCMLDQYCWVLRAPSADTTHTHTHTHTHTDNSMWRVQMETFFFYSNHRAVISFVTCVTSFVENVKSRGSWNILFLLYEHTTQTKNIADRSFAVSTRQWRHNAIVARSHYGSAPTMQCGFLYAPWDLISRNWQVVTGQNWDMYNSGKRSDILVMHNEK